MVRNNDGTGSLKIVQPLDFEDLLQSNGFRFRIQVNDKGEDNDNDKYHVAYSWVVVKLRDINDNKPIFERPNIEVSVPENAEVGKSLETFKATDPDQGGKSKVNYIFSFIILFYWLTNFICYRFHTRLTEPQTENGNSLLTKKAQSASRDH